MVTAYSRDRRSAVVSVLSEGWSMQETLLPLSFSRILLSLILLTANIGAPFLTSDVGRAFLDNLGQHVPAHSVARVRVVAHAGSTHGFRAVVGLAKGESPEALGPNVSKFFALIHSPADIPPHRLIELPVLQPIPPQRC